jgi:phospholipase/carboxylesterase
MPLPRRQGPPPQTTPAPPHQQLTQIAPYALQVRLREAVGRLEHVELEASAVSVPGAVGFLIPRGADATPHEFGHCHPSYDGSMHLILPEPVAAVAGDAGWGEPHPLAGSRLPRGTMMIFGPRDVGELEVCLELVRASHRFVTEHA